MFDPDKDKRPSLEIVKWYDHNSYSESTWRGYKKIQELKPIPIFSVGWVIKEDKDCVVLVATSDREQGQGSGEMCLLKGTIAKRWKLKDPSSK